MELRRQKKWVERLYATVAIIIGLILLMSFLGRYLMISMEAPENMIVYALEDANVYYAPPYIENNGHLEAIEVKKLKAMTIKEAKELNYKRDANSNDLGYFKEMTTLNYNILLAFGLTEPNPSRWNEDGTWNW
ncbi:MAG: hypothetical protein LBK69_07690 [Syntrophomonadaceae bacterium]|jgi:hypothetical protein|nr:hypothetical protein [Syntrophomonadaceae bacterium]